MQKSTAVLSVPVSSNELVVRLPQHLVITDGFGG